MEKPTDEQMKESWGLCGFRDCEKINSIMSMPTGWYYPDGKWDKDIPAIDLNNLFLYAPKRMTPVLWRKIIREWASTLTANCKVDTLVLFWAIYKVMKE